MRFQSQKTKAALEMTTPISIAATSGSRFDGRATRAGRMDCGTICRPAGTGASAVRGVNGSRRGMNDASIGTNGAGRGTNGAGRGANGSSRGVNSAARVAGGAGRGADGAERGIDGAERGVDGAERGVDGPRRGSTAAGSTEAADVRIPENFFAQPRQYLALSRLGVWQDPQNLVMTSPQRSRTAQANCIGLRGADDCQTVAESGYPSRTPKDGCIAARRRGIRRTSSGCDASRPAAAGAGPPHSAGLGNTAAARNACSCRRHGERG